MNCDPIAPWYRWLEYAGFGRALERRRVAFLNEVSGARRVLVLGDGDGRALAELIRHAPYAHIDCVDRSERMLHLARRRVDATGVGARRVVFHHADALNVALPDAAYDLIVTHFFLDCLDEPSLARLLERVGPAARPSARWLVSEFRQPALWATVLVKGLYLFFRITTGLRTRRLADHHPVFARHGFRHSLAESSWKGLLTSELWVRGGI